MKILENLLYTEDHEYCKIENGVATIGITDYAQEQLGDITYLELPSVGDSFSKGDSFGTVEAVKAASDMYIPVSGEIVEVNSKLEDTPELVNSDCYGNGWIVKVKLSDDSEVESLLSADDYKKIIEE